MFVDCGDIILSKYCFLAIKDELDNHRTLDIYEWCWIDSSTNEAHHAYEPSTPGKIYRRAFLEAYDIYPYNIEYLRPSLLYSLTYQHLHLNQLYLKTVKKSRL